MLPAVRIAYFDPRRRGYQVAQSSSIPVDVQPGTNEDGSKVIYAGGYSGFGVSASRFGARLGLALLDGSSAPECELDLVSRLPNIIPPEPFRWIGAKLTMYALADADEKGGWRRAWLRLVHAMGFPL